MSIGNNLIWLSQSIQHQVMKIDRKTLFGVAVILLLFGAWGIGNLMYTMPHIYGGGEIVAEFEREDAAQGEVIEMDFPYLKYIYQIFMGAIIAVSVIGIIIGIIQRDKTLAFNMVATAIGTLIGLVIFASAYWMYYRLPPPEEAGGTSTAQGATETIPRFFFGSVGGLLILFVCIALVVLLVYSKMKVYLESKIVEEEEKDVKGMVSATLDRTVDDLYSGKDIRSTIIRCYQQMCRALEDTGVDNAESMTPREFIRLSTRKLDVSRNTLREMTGMFEEARYSVHSLGEGMRERALKDLTILKKELGGIKDEVH